MYFPPQCKSNPRFVNDLTSKHDVTDLYEEKVGPLYRQLHRPCPVPAMSGLGLLPDIRHRRREAGLQDHRASCYHRDAAYS